MIEDGFEVINSNAEELRKDMCDRFEELSGRTLSLSSPENLIFSTVAYAMALREEQYNDDIKQNYIRYAREERLDLAGELYGTRGERVKEKNAKATFRFSILSPKGKNIVVPKGSLMKYGDLYFATDEEYIILAGDKSVEGIATCTTTGTIGNGIPIGDISIMVDLFPYFEKVENITISNGGTDIEEDDFYRERLRLVPDSFSVAGPKGAYIFWTKTVSSSIVDVSVMSHRPCEVDIYILTKDGKPSAELKKEVETFVSSSPIRPLTDKVTIKDPVEVNYSINIDYYINKEDEPYVSNIKSRAESTIQEYIKLQREKLGLDIIPDEIVKRLKLAGVKRVVMTQPLFQKIEENEFATTNSIDLNYAGVEDI